MLFNPRKRLEGHFVDALDIVRIEWAAMKGRWFLPKQLSTQGKEYLQLGSGNDQIKGFLNSCYFLNKQAEAWVDVRFPLRFPDNCWRGIYAHHVVEHISYVDASQLFAECWRTLQPGGVFRMIVPDVEVFIDYFGKSDTKDRSEIFSLYPKTIMKDLDVLTPLEMIDYVFRDNKFNRHSSAWDWETAKTRLMKAGFPRIVRQEVNVSLDPRLAGHDKIHWSKFSLYVEAQREPISGFAAADILPRT
jgi:predicted SAM-dependent methyltransferase